MLQSLGGNDSRGVKGAGVEDQESATPKMIPFSNPVGQPAPYRQIGLSISVPNSPQRRKVRQVQELGKKLLVRIRLLRIDKTRGLSPSFVYLTKVPVRLRLEGQAF